MDDREYITRDEAEHLMEDAAERGARRVLKQIGVDAEGDWKAVQADMQHLRQSREGSDMVRRWGKRAAVTAFVSSLGWLIWQGIVQALRGAGG